MNIKSINYININNIYKTNNKVEAKPMNNKKTDTVEISNLGKYLNEISNKEGFDMDKVNEIKRRVESGTYKIDSNELAKKIIEKTKGEL